MRVTLAEVCGKGQYGLVASATSSPLGPKFLRTTDMIDGSIDWSEVPYCEVDHRKQEQCLLSEGDLVISRTGANAGAAAYVADPPKGAVFAGYLVRFRAKPSLADARFLGYVLRSRQWADYVTNTRTGSAQPQLNAVLMGRFAFDLPPLDEQRRIAEVLGALDDLIDTNNRQIERLRLLVAVLYQRALTSGATRVISFLDVFKVEFGGAFKGNHFTRAGVGLPLIRIRDLKTASSDTWTTERLPNEVVVSPGDILFGMDAEFRASQWVGPQSLLNQRVCRVTTPGASNAFALEALKAPLSYIEGHKTGTTVIHLNKRDLEETKILVPSDAAVSEFDAVAEPLRLWSVSLSEENRQLLRTRDELLPLLLSGAVRVRPEEVAA